MNTLYNTAPYSQQPPANKSFSGYGDNKRGMFLQPESLFSMAMYDFESMGQQQQMEPLPAQQPVQQPQQPAPAFHPVDEYKDMSLKQLLDLSDDYLFGDEEDANVSQSSMFNPLPLNVPSGQNVAQAAAQAAVHSSYDAPPQTLGMDNMTPLAPGLNYDTNVVPMMATSAPSPSSTKKRRREVSDDEEELNNEGRFRPYQAGQWAERFNDLKAYREANGNCLVPHTYKENLPLARWVKRQRYQYKLMMEGKSSTMTEERVQALEEIGFVWDSQGAAWGERLEELKEFRSIYMHCNVPSNYSENPQLATWVKCQRRQYKLHMEGKPSNMTAQRIGDLESVGFEWLLRSYKKARTN